MSSVSVVISAWNEEDKIARCLASVKWADEIIVVDNSSSDATPAIAKKMGAIVYTRLNNPMLNVNKNYGFEKATSEWILCLDADEEIPQELAQEIKRTLKKEQQVTGYWIGRKNIIFGKWIEHGLWWPDRQLRLFRRGKGRFPQKHVHEYIEINGPTGELATPYTHYNYETISQFIRKMDTIYTENEVHNLIASGYQFVWYDAFRFPLSDFVKIFFAQEAYKDGLHGLVLSILQSFYSFIVFAKLWEKRKFEERSMTLSSVEEQIVRSGYEMRYWMLTAKIKNSPSWWERIRLKVARRLLTRTHAI